MVLFSDHTQHIIGLMQAKYIIVSQYWKKVVKGNTFLRLPGRLWGLLDDTQWICFLLPECLLLISVVGKVATPLKILAA